MLQEQLIFETGGAFPLKRMKPVVMFCRIQRKETATGGVLWEKVFLEISHNSQENTCVRVSFLIMLQA